MLKELNDIYVYHGSYTKVNKIDLTHAKRKKDFGAGFYVTTDKKQAMKFARLIAKRNGMKYGYINSYKLSNFTNLEVLEFLDANEEWLNCIVGFRSEEYSYLKSSNDLKDVIYGKIVDDETSLVINAYISGAYGKIGSEKASKIAIQLLEPNNLKDQICFKTKKSLEKLEYVSCEVVKI